MNDLRVSFPKPCGEKWEAMRPKGCDRFCQHCEKTIYDLSRLTLEEAEDLARSGGEVCVRALVDAGHMVKLKPGRSTRRMFATIGASVGILAASSQAVAAERQKLGAIKGAVLGGCGSGMVMATAADGSVYRAKIGIDGRYKVKRLPAGPYQVKVDSGLYSESREAKAPRLMVPPSKVVVDAGRTSVLDLTDPHGCIIIGMLQIEDGAPHSDG